MQHCLSIVVCLFSISTELLTAAPVSSNRSDETIPRLKYEAVPDFFQLPAGENFVEVAAVAINSKGHVYVFHRGKHPLMEFDASGKFIRINPEGRVLLALGRMRIPGDDVLHFNQPTDVAFDREGNIYVADGEGNSRVLKFNKYGNLLLAWGMKGDGPGQFDLPHSIAINDDLVYVADRENARIQIFDLNGRYLRE